MDSAQKQILFQERNPLGRVVYFLAGIAEVFLLFRFTMKLFGASQNNDFVNLVYDVSAWLVAPFVGIFEQVEYSGAVFEAETIIAMTVYAIGAYILATLFDLSTKLLNR